VQQEKAVLVCAEWPERRSADGEALEELRGLALSAGAVVVGTLVQRLDRPVPGTYIGSGKLQELVQLVRQSGADVVIFDNDLTPAQTRNLELATGVKVLDRTELILDIFATRARTVEARLQVELAQLEYSLPRLRHMWKHLSRIKGGIGMRGPGETQLEEDRRLAAARIRDLKRRLHGILARRQRQVLERQDEFTVSLVGYTNAGKSTLMRALTGADVPVADQLFSTLDTRTRQWRLGGGVKVLLSDTVGFIRHLPHHLVASFRATLEEARQARLLLHVVDASSPRMEEQIASVNEVLADIGCDRKAILLVLNKVDRLSDPLTWQLLHHRYPQAILVSARTGFGLEELREAVRNRLAHEMLEAEIEAPASNGRVLAWLHRHGEVHRQEILDDRIRIWCHLPAHALQQLTDPGIVIRTSPRDGTDS